MSVEKTALVLNHSRAKGTDKVVLIGIANHDGDGGAWPSIETLMRYANVAERSVQDSIARLVTMGELAVEINAGGTHKTRADRRTNLYRILVAAPEPEADGVRSSAPRETNGVRSSAERGAVEHPNGVRSTAPEPSFNHPENYPETRDVEFDRFWSMYPRKVDKKSARKVWDRAIQRTRAETIIAGLAERARWWQACATPVRLIKHPATWLNGECWNDEIEPVERVGRQTAAERHAGGAAIADAFNGESPFDALKRMSARGELSA